VEKLPTVKQTEQRALMNFMAESAAADARAHDACTWSSAGRSVMEETSTRRALCEILAPAGKERAMDGPRAWASQGKQRLHARGRARCRTVDRARAQGKTELEQGEGEGKTMARERRCRGAGSRLEAGWSSWRWREMGREVRRWEEK
jgi:hypothetical protein